MSEIPQGEPPMWLEVWRCENLRCGAVTVIPLQNVERIELNLDLTDDE